MPDSGDEGWWRAPAVRFLIMGGTNTAVTAAIVVLLSLYLPGWLAFSIAFALGLALSVVLTGRWVFSSTLTARRTVLFVGAYLVIYLVGLAFVSLVTAMGGQAWLNGASVLLTAPLSFLAGRFIFPSSQLRQGNNV
jgi:putative flippase GtrA